MRAGWIVTTLAPLLTMGVRPALAQAGGGGTGGAEQGLPEVSRRNRNPALTRKPRPMPRQARRLEAPAPVDGFAFGPGLFGTTVTVGDHGIVTRFPDPDVTWRIGGRLHLDAGVAATNSRAFASAFEDTFVRRAFIESYLTVAGKVEAAFQYDTAPSDLHLLQDAGVSYRGLGPLMLSVENFKELMSFDQLTSDNNTLSLERALSTALTPGRNFGGLAGWNGEHWTLVAGLWSGDPNTGLADEGLSGTARATVAPILTAVQVLHFGLSGSRRALDRGSSHFAFETTVANTPETNLLPASSALVSTGTIADASAIERAGMEAACQYGLPRVQGEAARETVIRENRSDVTFASVYAEAGWVLNGNGRPYRMKPS